MRELRRLVPPELWVSERVFRVPTDYGEWAVALDDMTQVFSVQPERYSPTAPALCQCEACTRERERFGGLSTRLHGRGISLNVPHQPNAEDAKAARAMSLYLVLMVDPAWVEEVACG